MHVPSDVELVAFAGCTQKFGGAVLLPLFNNIDINGVYDKTLNRLMRQAQMQSVLPDFFQTGSQLPTKPYSKYDSRQKTIETRVILGEWTIIIEPPSEVGHNIKVHVVNHVLWAKKYENKDCFCCGSKCNVLSNRAKNPKTDKKNMVFRSNDVDEVFSFVYRLELCWLKKQTVG